MPKLLLFLLSFLTPTAAFAPVSAPSRPSLSLSAVATNKDVSALLARHRPVLDDLAAAAPDLPEISLLRFALAFPDRREAVRAAREAAAYRRGPGRSIVTAAAEAVSAATATGTWDNGPVRDAAPRASAINRFLTPANVLTLGTEEGDLVYIIRASGIDDRRLMSRVSVKNLTFLKISYYVCYNATFASSCALSTLP